MKNCKRCEAILMGFEERGDICNECLSKGWGEDHDDTSEEYDQQMGHEDVEDPLAGQKPICQLSGSDGNVFAIIGLVSKTLKQAGMRDEANEWTERAMSASSYVDVLTLTHEYVDVH